LNLETEKNIMTIKLYYYPSNASLAPHILLEEIGASYELVLVDSTKGEHKSAAYLALNPAGVIPTLVDGEIVVTETAAIMLHLADKFPASQLIAPLQTAERAACYRWLIYMTNTLQAELMHYFYPDRLGGLGGENAELIKTNATARIMMMLDILEAEFVRHGGTFLLGARYTIADIFLFMMCRWTRNMPNPARVRPHLNQFLKMMSERPAVIRAHEQESLAKPWY
jgi:glutathione S-transferase